MANWTYWKDPQRRVDQTFYAWWRSSLRSPMRKPWICPAEGAVVPCGSWERMVITLRDGRTRFEGARCAQGHRVRVDVDAADTVTVRVLSFLSPGLLAPAP